MISRVCNFFYCAFEKNKEIEISQAIKEIEVQTRKINLETDQEIKEIEKKTQKKQQKQNK